MNLDFTVEPRLAGFFRRVHTIASFPCAQTFDGDTREFRHRAYSVQLFRHSCTEQKGPRIVQNLVRLSSLSRFCLPRCSEVVGETLRNVLKAINIWN